MFQYPKTNKENVTCCIDYTYKQQTKNSCDPPQGKKPTLSHHRDEPSLILLSRLIAGSMGAWGPSEAIPKCIKMLKTTSWKQWTVKIKMELPIVFRVFWPPDHLSKLFSSLLFLWRLANHCKTHESSGLVTPKVFCGFRRKVTSLMFTCSRSTKKYTWHICT